MEETIVSPTESVVTTETTEVPSDHPFMTTETTEVPSDHPFMTTPLDDYTVTEGLLLLILLFMLLHWVWKLIREVF